MTLNTSKYSIHLRIKYWIKRLEIVSIIHKICIFLSISWPKKCQICTILIQIILTKKIVKFVYFFKVEKKIFWLKSCCRWAFVHKYGLNKVNKRAGLITEIKKYTAHIQPPSNAYKRFAFYKAKG